MCLVIFGTSMPLIAKYKKRGPAYEFVTKVDVEKAQKEILSPLFHPERQELATDIAKNMTDTALKNESEKPAIHVDALTRELSQLIQPWKFGDPNELIEFNFEDAELKTMVAYIEDRFHIKFILDSVLNPMPQGGRNVVGIKISYKTNAPLTKQDAWALFLKFLDMAGLAVVPGPTENVYRIMTTDPRAQNSASKEPIPTFIGINPELLPNDDSLIRYVYLVRNANQDTIKKLVDTFKSLLAPELIPIPEIRGLVITDKSYNIKTMLEIISELDKLSMPEVLSIVRLQHADAAKVADFYKTLVKEEDQVQKDFAARVMGTKRPQTLTFFPPGVRVIPEPRTNVLILLGPEDGTHKVEDFILKELDKQNTLQYRFTKVYPLKYVSAKAVANILNQAVKFNANQEAAKVGGVRDGDKYFKPMSIVPEESGNRLIITGDYEDYLRLVEVIKRIDIEQPQVGLKILIVNFEQSDQKELGTQIRNKKPGITGLIGDNVNFQTSGLGGKSIVENSSGSGATRLLGDLVNLATGGAAGSTYITLGSDAFGVWGMLRMLESYGRTTVVANPFIVTSNNYAASMAVGLTRRVKDAETKSTTDTTSYTTLDAKLDIKITPRISYEGYVTLDIYINNTAFTVTTATSEDGNRTVKEIQTSITLANNETTILGGLIKTDSTDAEDLGTPFARIPIVGWLLGKLKTQVKTNSSLLIFITPEIIPPDNEKIAREFTNERFGDVARTLQISEQPYYHMDPIHSLFFGDTDRGQNIIDQYVSEEGRYTYPAQKSRIKKAASTRHEKSLGDYL